MLGHSTPEKGEALLFKNSEEELFYLQRENAHLKKQHKIELICAQVLGKNTHQRSESLDALVEPPAHKQPTSIELPIRRFTVLLLNYSSHKQKTLQFSFVESVTCSRLMQLSTLRKGTK